MEQNLFHSKYWRSRIRHKKQNENLKSNELEQVAPWKKSKWLLW